MVLVFVSVIPAAHPGDGAARQGHRSRAAQRGRSSSYPACRSRRSSPQLVSCPPSKGQGAPVSTFTVARIGQRADGGFIGGVVFAPMVTVPAALLVSLPVT